MRERVRSRVITEALRALLVLSLLVIVAEDQAQDPTDIGSREHQMRIAGRDSRPAHSVSPIPSAAAVSAHDLNVPPKARKEFEKGRKLLLESRRSSESIAFLRKAIDIAPLYSEAHFLLGVAYIDLSRFSEAETSLAKATSINEKNGSANLALGYCLIEERKYGQSEAPLVRGVESNPDSSLGHYDLARTYYALNRFGEAEEHVRKAISLTPEVAAMHALLANLLLRTDQAGALLEFEETLRLEPGLTQIRDVITELKANSSPLIADGPDE